MGKLVIVNNDLYYNISNIDNLEPKDNSSAITNENLYKEITKLKLDLKISRIK